MKKKIPFDIEYRPQIESGEVQVVTRDDRKVDGKSIYWDYNDKEDFHDLLAVVKDDHLDKVYAYHRNGRVVLDEMDRRDLFLIVEGPKFKVGQSVIRKDGKTGLSIIDHIDNTWYYDESGERLFRIQCQDDYKVVEKPKFKPGQTIRNKGLGAEDMIIGIEEDHYNFRKGGALLISHQNEWEVVDKELEEEIGRFLSQYSYPREDVNFEDFARYFANWQKQQDIKIFKELASLADYQDGCYALESIQMRLNEIIKED